MVWLGTASTWSGEAARISRTSVGGVKPRIGKSNLPSAPQHERERICNRLPPTCRGMFSDPTKLCGDSCAFASTRTEVPARSQDFFSALKKLLGASGKVRLERTKRSETSRAFCWRHTKLPEVARDISARRKSYSGYSQDFFSCKYDPRSERMMNGKLKDFSFIVCVASNQNSVACERKCGPGGFIPL